MKQESAEAIALQVLAWVAGEKEVVSAFLASTGVDPSEFARSASDPRFLASVLDFLLEDDVRVIAFCDMSGMDRGKPLQARAALPGGNVVHWT